MNPSIKNRIAAVGDIHVKPDEKGKWADFFRLASDNADVLLLCGDLTDTGHVSEAEVLAEELKHCSIPVIAVLGNHDYETDQQEEIKKILKHRKMHILNGDSIVINDVGYAGIKGFGGGFDNFMLPIWGEKMNKLYVQESVNEALLLDRALAHLDTNSTPLQKVVVVMHYSPIKQTIIGEPEQIFPFLGSSRLVEPLDNRRVDVVFHGHAHIGTFEGKTSMGVKVYNVAYQLLKKQGLETPFFLYDV